MITEEQLQALWDEIKRRVKAVELNMPLYRAVDAAVPITMDVRTVVIGLPGEAASDLSTFALEENAQIIQRVLNTVANKPLELLVIEGTTVADYEHHQERAAATEEARRRSAAKFESERLQPAEGEAEGDGDSDEAGAAGGEDVDRFDPQSELSSTRLLLQLNRHLHVRYRNLKNRGSALVRAHFLLDSMGELHQVVLRVNELETSEITRDRQIGRAIDRLADLVNIDANLVAVEYERYRQSLV